MKTGFFRNSLLSSLTLLAAGTMQASAQNYVDARNYATPNVVVDLTVLDNSGYQFSDIVPNRITPAPALRGIRTPNGIISSGSNTAFADTSASIPVPPPADRPVLRQELAAAVPVMPKSAAPVNDAPSAEDVAAVMPPVKLRAVKQPTTEPQNIAPTPTEDSVSSPKEIKTALAKAAEPDEIVPPSEITSQNNSVISLLFPQGASKMSEDSEKSLLPLADSLKANPDRRIQIKAYASGTPETANTARRLSLTRALNARTYLLGKGVKATQIDIRALGIGNATDNPARGGAPVDRLDVVVIE